jgi:hypothetical protein
MGIRLLPYILTWIIEPCFEKRLHTSGPAGAGVGEREYSTVVPWFDACVAGLI